MDVPANFKLDVRVRARLLAKNTITEAEVSKHLESLADADGACETVTLAQPALQPLGDRPKIPQALVRPPPRSIAPAPMPVDDGWGDDIDDDDDDEEDLKPVAKKPAAVPARVAPPPPEPESKPEPAAAGTEAEAADEDEDDDDAPAADADAEEPEGAESTDDEPDEDDESDEEEAPGEDE